MCDLRGYVRQIKFGNANNGKPKDTHYGLMMFLSNPDLQMVSVVIFIVMHHHSEIPNFHDLLMYFHGMFIYTMHYVYITLSVKIETT